jgi:hypothetical protein
MRAIILGILSQFAFALSVFILDRKLAGMNPFLLNFLLAGFGAALLLPVMLFTPILPIISDARILGWIILIAFFFIVLGEMLYVSGVLAAKKAGDLRPFALTALFFPIILAILEIQRNPLDRWFLIGFLTMAIGFAIIVIRSH